MRSNIVRKVLLGTTAALIGGAAIAQPLFAEPMNTPAAAAAVTAESQRALSALSPAVGQLSDSRALETAFHAYFAYQAAHPDEIKKPYLYFVDFGQSQNAKRGYVFDMKTLKVIDGPFTVAQGAGSGSGVPSRFSNAANSRATSLGLYVTKNQYAFTGHSGGKAYRSAGLRMDGKSKGFNDNALARGVVTHGAPYVGADRAGHSAGCSAMELERAQKLVPELADGSVVFLYAPNAQWLANDQWVKA